MSNKKQYRIGYTYTALNGAMYPKTEYDWSIIDAETAEKSIYNFKKLWIEGENARMYEYEVVINSVIECGVIQNEDTIDNCEIIFRTDDCLESGFVEKNNAFSIEADEKFMKSTKLSDLYKEIMSRENRIGLPHINIYFGKEWIVGKIGCSNLGYNFRGRISTNSMPQIDKNMTLFEMLYD